MTLNKPIKLIHLLTTQDEIFRNDFFEKNVLFDDIGLMPKTVVAKIYKRRMKTSELIAKELIDSIDQFSEEAILLTKMTYDNKEFIIFTSKDITTLIGILEVRDQTNFFPDESPP